MEVGTTVAIEPHLAVMINSHGFVHIKAEQKFRAGERVLKNFELR